MVSYEEGLHKGVFTMRWGSWGTILKATRIAILTSDKVDSRRRDIIRDKEEHFIVVKRSIPQENEKF